MPPAGLGCEKKSVHAPGRPGLRKENQYTPLAGQPCEKKSVHAPGRPSGRPGACTDFSLGPGHSKNLMNSLGFCVRIHEKSVHAPCEKTVHAPRTVFWCPQCEKTISTRSWPAWVAKEKSVHAPGRPGLRKENQYTPLAGLGCEKKISTRLLAGLAAGQEACTDLFFAGPSKLQYVLIFGKSKFQYVLIFRLNPDALVKTLPRRASSAAHAWLAGRCVGRIGLWRGPEAAWRRRCVSRMSGGRCGPRNAQNIYFRDVCCIAGS